MKRKNAQKKRKKALLRAKKSSKKSALRGIPLGALWGNFRGAKKWLRHVCAPRKFKEGVAVHLLNHLLFLPRPPPAPRLAPPLLHDFQGVRGRFKEGCLDRLRRCARAETDRQTDRQTDMNI
jgi:hypothetical protein